MLIHVLKSICVGAAVFTAGSFAAMLDNLPIDFLPHVGFMSLVAACAAFIYFLD